MIDNRRISICLPTYNRYEMTIESFAQVIDDPRIGEIVIVDDCSTDNCYNELLKRIENINLYHTCNIKLYRNVINQDCYRNKNYSIAAATNDWCILLDSDNIIGTDYLDSLYSISEWEPNTIYQPSFAKPHFDFRKFSGSFVDRNNIRNFIGDEMFQTGLNAANFFVNRQTYLNAFNPDIDPVTSDSIYMAYRLLEQGNKYYFVPGLEYEHRIHEGSHYQKNVHKTPAGFHQEVINKLASL